MAIAPSSRVPLIIFTFIWISASVAQVVLVKKFQLLLTPQLPWFLADLAGVGFIVTVPVYLYYIFAQSRVAIKDDKTETVKSLLLAPFHTRRIVYHLFGGFFTALQLVSISFALEMMPGSTFTVVRGSELLIALLMSMFIFGKTYNRYHYLAVAMMLSGGGIVAVAMSKPATAAHADYNMVLGVIIVICGVAGSSSAQAVLTEWVYSKKMLIKARNDHLTEAGTWTMFFTFLWLTVSTMLFSNGEYRIWWSTLSPHLDSVTIVCLLALCASRAIALVTKIGVTVHSDAMFNRSLSTVRRATQITLMAILFHEVLPVAAIFGIIMTLAASTLYGMAKAPEKRADKPSDALKQKLLDVEKVHDVETGPKDTVRVV